MQELCASAHGFADSFSGDITGIRGQQFRRVELCQICQRNEVLHHLNIALHFQLTTANQGGKLLAIAKFRQHTGVSDNGAVSIACPFAQYINLAFAEHQNQ
ncbi:Uncharacterised protein [Klebsiella variicola]|nr:Uncharacterised protein [Klebsiella variicola]